MQLITLLIEDTKPLSFSKDVDKTMLIWNVSIYQTIRYVARWIMADLVQALNLLETGEMLFISSNKVTSSSIKGRKQNIVSQEAISEV